MPSATVLLPLFEASYPPSILLSFFSLYYPQALRESQFRAYEETVCSDLKSRPLSPRFFEGSTRKPFSFFLFFRPCHLLAVSASENNLLLEGRKAFYARNIVLEKFYSHWFSIEQVQGLSFYFDDGEFNFEEIAGTVMGSAIVIPRIPLISLLYPVNVRFSEVFRVSWS